MVSVTQSLETMKVTQHVVCRVLSTKAGIQRHHEAPTRDGINLQGWQEEAVQSDITKEEQGMKWRGQGDRQPLS